MPIAKYVRVDGESTPVDGWEEEEDDGHSEGMVWLTVSNEMGHRTYCLPFPTAEDPDNEHWFHSDNNELVSSERRACAECGEFRRADGHDPCLGNLPGVNNACCGHGKEEGYVSFDNGVVIRGDFSIEHHLPPGKEQPE